ncbi:GNAT family N-acetyltransferase [Pseudomonas luteola]|uniref:GNAT family N-acetyltransferase n=1 Tax=Pseudomonas TaxID=286 RepID=UPI003D9FE9A2
MSSLPLLKTHRLQLRPYVPADAPFHYLLADNPDIASMTGTLPSPYTLELAEHWIPIMNVGLWKEEALTSPL